MSRAISIHAPREGERLPPLREVVKTGAFQSTLPARGSDCAGVLIQGFSTHFNPRSPRGGATESNDITMSAIDISIHAPREGERRTLTDDQIAVKVFQSTLPARGSDLHLLTIVLSIAPFQSTLPARGSDSQSPIRPYRLTDFNPRSPRGGATNIFKTSKGFSVYFNPRSPRGGATTERSYRGRGTCDFNPRSPRGGATCA